MSAGGSLISACIERFRNQPPAPPEERKQFRTDDFWWMKPSSKTENCPSIDETLGPLDETDPIQQSLNDPFVEDDCDDDARPRRDIGHLAMSSPPPRMRADEVRNLSADDSIETHGHGLDLSGSIEVHLRESETGSIAERGDMIGRRQRRKIPTATSNRRLSRRPHDTDADDRTEFSHRTTGDIDIVNKLDDYANSLLKKCDHLLKSYAHGKSTSDPARQDDAAGRKPRNVLETRKIVNPPWMSIYTQAAVSPSGSSTSSLASSSPSSSTDNLIPLEVRGMRPRPQSISPSSRTFTVTGRRGIGPLDSITDLQGSIDAIAILNGGGDSRRKVRKSTGTEERSEEGDYRHDEDQDEEEVLSETINSSEFVLSPDGNYAAPPHSAESADIDISAFQLAKNYKKKASKPDVRAAVHQQVDGVTQTLAESTGSAAFLYLSSSSERASSAFGSKSESMVSVSGELVRRPTATGTQRAQKEVTKRGGAELVSVTESGIDGDGMDDSDSTADEGAAVPVSVSSRHDNSDHRHLGEEEESRATASATQIPKRVTLSTADAQNAALDDVCNVSETNREGEGNTVTQDILGDDDSLDIRPILDDDASDAAIFVDDLGSPFPHIVEVDVDVGVMDKEEADTQDTHINTNIDVVNVSTTDTATAAATAAAAVAVQQVDRKLSVLEDAETRVIVNDVGDKEQGDGEKIDRDSANKVHIHGDDDHADDTISPPAGSSLSSSASASASSTSVAVDNGLNLAIEGESHRHINDDSIRVAEPLAAAHTDGTAGESGSTEIELLSQEDTAGIVGSDVHLAPIATTERSAGDTNDDNASDKVPCSSSSYISITQSAGAIKVPTSPTAAVTEEALQDYATSSSSNNSNSSHSNNTLPLSITSPLREEDVAPYLDDEIVLYLWKRLQKVNREISTINSSTDNS